MPLDRQSFIQVSVMNASLIFVTEDKFTNFIHFWEEGHSI